MEDMEEKFDNLSCGSTSSGSTRQHKFYWHDQYYTGVPDWEKSIDLKVSRDLVLERAKLYADYWKDVNVSFLDRRSFQVFERFLSTSGLDWHNIYHKYIGPQLAATKKYTPEWSPPASAEPSYPKLISDSNWVMASKFYNRSLALIQLLEKINLEAESDFSRDQARLLKTFLDHFIEIQKEQRVVASSFSEHLRQLKKCDAVFSIPVSSNAFSLEVSSNAVHDVVGKCPFGNYRKALDKWHQKHLIDSLYIMSRESSWLLKKLEDSYSISPLFVEESKKILYVIDFHMRKFKQQKELLDYDLLSGRPGYVQSYLVQDNLRILNNFRDRIKGLQEQGIGRSVSERVPDDIREYVTGVLLECFEYVLSQCKDDRIQAILYIDTKHGSGNMPSSLRDAFTKAAEETLELINETVEKLDSVMLSYLTIGGSPLGNITLWNILFESSLINFKLDLICTKYGETTKLGVELSFGENVDPSVVRYVETHLARLHVSISKLLSAADGVLLEFVANHRTVAEIAYMLGDAFTTGGAGMDQVLANERPDSSSELLREDDQGKKMDFDVDFPWDKHNVPDLQTYGLDHPRKELVNANPCSVYGPGSDPESDTEFT